MARSWSCMALWCTLLLLSAHCFGSAAAARGNSITGKDFAAAIEQLLPALQELALSVAEGPADQASSGRKLLATATTTQLKTASRVNLLAADAFSMVYTGGNLARAIFALMAPMVVAGQTGTISVNAEYMLNMSQLLANYVATMGDLFSKGAKFTADGILPI